MYVSSDMDMVILYINYNMLTISNIYMLLPNITSSDSRPKISTQSPGPPPRPLLLLV